MRRSAHFQAHRRIVELRFFMLTSRVLEQLAVDLAPGWCCLAGPTVCAGRALFGRVVGEGWRPTSSGTGASIGGAPRPEAVAIGGGGWGGGTGRPLRHSPEVVPIGSCAAAAVRRPGWGARRLLAPCVGVVSRPTPGSKRVIPDAISPKRHPGRGAQQLVCQLPLVGDLRRAVRWFDDGMASRNKSLLMGHSASRPMVISQVAR
jgi:hypothetical protein